MTAFNEKLNRAAEGATCRLLDTIGEGLIYAGAASIVAGGAGVVPITFGAAALMASQYGCSWDPDAPGPPPSGEGQVGGCLQVQVRAEVVFKGNGPTQPTSPPLEWRRLDKAIFTGINPDGRYTYTLEGLNGSGTPTSLPGVSVGADYVPGYFTLNSDASNPCTDDKPIPTPPNPVIPPYEHTDPVDGCKIIVNFKGFQTDEKGHLNPVYKMEPGPETRTDGGRIGGCTFNNIVYTGAPIGGGGEPPVVGPWDPEWDEGDDPFPWKDWLLDVLAGAVGSQIAALINEIFDLPYKGTTYRLVSVCELDEDGEPVSKEVLQEIPSANTFSAVIKRIDALVPLLQGQKDFKQPICAPVKPQGEFRTIGFISENRSPNGRDYLRKRLRYRSMSGLGLGELIDYWKNFEFDAGPVTVKHRGASWGTITVWAASADEGKRVIRHAAGEALIDADQTGRWEISGSSSARLGMPGRMKVNSKGGYYWITARDDSNNRPRVGLT